MKPFALILIAFVCCASHAADKTVTNKELGFEITFPETWTITEKPAKPMVAEGAAKKLVGAKSTAGLNVSHYDWDSDLEAMASAVIEGYETNLAGFKTLERINVTLSEHKAIKITGVQNKTNLQSISYCVLLGRHGYLFTCMALKEDYDKYIKDMDAIVKSFKILK
jgi:hypothetical protein